MSGVKRVRDRSWLQKMRGLLPEHNPKRVHRFFFLSMFNSPLLSHRSFGHVRKPVFLVAHWISLYWCVCLENISDWMSPNSQDAYVDIMVEEWWNELLLHYQHRKYWSSSSSVRENRIQRAWMKRRKNGMENSEQVCWVEVFFLVIAHIIIRVNAGCLPLPKKIQRWMVTHI